MLGDFCSKCNLAADDSPPDQRHITHLSENHRANIDALKNFLYKMNEDAVRAGSLAEKLKEGIDGLYDGEDPNFAARELKLSGKFRQKQEELRKELEAQMDSMLAKVELPKEFVSYFYFGKEDTVKGRRLSLDEWRKLQPNGRDMSDKAAQLPLALAHLYSNCFRVICAIHDGLFGERSINRMIGELLGKKNEADGTPVLILRNDPETGLSNGDTGIFWNGKVYFPEWTDNDENPGNPVFICKRSFFPDQLPDRTLAYAMTIHKSQGSGYDNVLMILPDKDSRIITRELIYTGISRTRERFMLWGKRDILETGIDRPTVRWSGLPYQFE